ncbi:glycosyltransferase family 4 protein [Candidatus Gottesmanbacteria bacterium]|nr:glycosyltransferase family 4 protein [Candidatus Gottesmanbacteria bacterium]
MIIAIDGYEANVKNRVGIGRYGYEILRHLRSIINKSDNLMVRVYLPSHPLADMPPECDWWQYRVASSTRLWTLIGLPWAIWRDKPRADVIFSPTHYIPRFIGIPKIMSIMDVSYLEYPGLFRLKDLYQLRRWTQYAVEHAVKILTISEFSKNAIMKAYQVPADHVDVIYPGLIMTGARCQMSDVRRKYALKTHYILSVGTLQPRKNFFRLIEAFSEFVRDSAHKEYELIIVGKKGWIYEDIISAPARFSVSDRVRFLDFVPDEDLPSLYRDARCFALPSLYEGFGLPVLEAMAQGCPVVVSNVSSLPEIAGKAGIYVDPNSVTDILRGLRDATDEDTAKKKLRVNLGLAQAKKFSWDKAAIETLRVIEEVAKEKI